MTLLDLEGEARRRLLDAAVKDAPGYEVVRATVALAREYADARAEEIAKAISARGREHSAPHWLPASDEMQRIARSFISKKTTEQAMWEGVERQVLESEAAIRADERETLSVLVEAVNVINSSRVAQDDQVLRHLGEWLSLVIGRRLQQDATPKTREQK